MAFFEKPLRFSVVLQFVWICVEDGCLNFSHQLYLETKQGNVEEAQREPLFDIFQQSDGGSQGYIYKSLPQMRAPETGIWDGALLLVTGLGASWTGNCPLCLIGFSWIFPLWIFLALLWTYVKVTAGNVVFLEEAAPWWFYLMPFSFPIEIVINCTQSMFSIPGILNAPLIFIAFVLFSRSSPG